MYILYIHIEIDHTPHFSSHCNLPFFSTIYLNNGHCSSSSSSSFSSSFDTNTTQYDEHHCKPWPFTPCPYFFVFMLMLVLLSYIHIYIKNKMDRNTHLVTLLSLNTSMPFLFRWKNLYNVLLNPEYILYIKSCTYWTRCTYT